MRVRPPHSGEECLPEFGVDGVRCNSLAHLQDAAVDVEQLAELCRIQRFLVHLVFPSDALHLQSVFCLAVVSRDGVVVFPTLFLKSLGDDCEVQ